MDRSCKSTAMPTRSFRWHPAASCSKRPMSPRRCWYCRSTITTIRCRNNTTQRWGDFSSSCPLLVDVRFQEPRQAMEIAVGIDVADHGDQRFGINEFLEWHVVQVELAGHG